MGITGEFWNVCLIQIVLRVSCGTECGVFSNSAQKTQFPVLNTHLAALANSLSENVSCISH